MKIDSAASAAKPARGMKLLVRQWKRTKRENVLLLIMLCLIAAIVVFKVFVDPAMTELSSREERLASLRAEAAEMRAKIAGAERSKTEYEQTKQIYDDCRLMLAAPMDEEMLDTTITQLLLRSGYEPRTLKMSALRSEVISFYDPAKSRTDAADAGEDVGSETERETEPTAGGVSDGNGETDATVLLYGIEIDAVGGQDDFLRLLGEMRGLTALKLASYRIEDPRARKGSPRSDLSGGAPSESVAKMRFEIYVFDESMFGTPDGEERAAETG
ncbi:MAG: hypothetical protein LBO81_02875 [Clostridiales Family XIII bacterium]|nr:hypothetical protein [Clostridiales Family XIII bacterium]